MAGEIVKHGGYASIALMGDDYDRVERIATGLAKSGVFKDAATTQIAMAKILLGADLGLTPTQALMTIDVVEGNARIRSVLLGAWVRQHADYEYKVTEHDAEHCVIDFYYKGEIEGTSAFTIEDAKAAGLVKDHPKSAWKAHPRNMLWARAMSNGVRWFCPDLTGGIPVFTEADTFDSTATEIGAGEGDGSEPGWSGLTPDQVDELEALLNVAEELGAGLDRAAVQMRLNHRPEAVAAWLEDTTAMLAKRQESEGQQSLDTEGGES